MASPAQRHAMRVSASQAAQREKAPLRNATAYEQMLVKLAADRRTLKNIHSNERKAEKKREMLPLYLPWVVGVLENGTGAQDAVLMTVMLWRLDAGDIPGALEIARYALRFNLSMPEGHSRGTAYMLAEEVALAAMRQRDAGQPVEVAQLMNTLELTKDADMPDEVRARLHKVMGVSFRDDGKMPLAMEHLQRAMQLDRNAGVKKDIERLSRELNPKPPAPAKKPAAARATKAKTQPISTGKRGPGRPRKNPV